MKKYSIGFSGGGSRGIAYLGAIYALEKYNNLDILSSDVLVLSGASIGAFFAAMFCIGYSHKELWNILYNENGIEFLTNFKKQNKHGILKLEKMEKWINHLVEKKIKKDNLITLKDVFEFSGKLLVLTTTRVKDLKCFYLSFKNFPDLPLSKAICMSICIPILFEPVKWKNDFYWDGGIKDNHPLIFFDDKEDNKNIEYILLSLSSINKINKKFLFPFLIDKPKKNKKQKFKNIKISTGKIKTRKLLLSRFEKRYLWLKGFHSALLF